MLNLLTKALSSVTEYVTAIWVREIYCKVHQHVFIANLLRGGIFMFVHISDVSSRCSLQG